MTTHRGSDRIARAFQACREQHSRAVIPYVTAGDPDLDATVRVTEALVAGGADIVEWGVPFSDPLADGVTIQRSAQRALAAGTTSRGVMNAVKRLRDGGCEVPLALLVYGNTMWRYGLEAFVRDAAAAGVDGLIVPDIPVEEADAVVRMAESAGVAWIPLVAPTSPPARIERVVEAGSGFVYCVSVTGVTGARAQLSSRLPDFLQRVRTRTSLPLAVGFGISGGEQAARIVRETDADGLIIGSALIQTLEEAASPAARAEKAKAFIAQVKGAVATALSSQPVPSRGPR